MFLTSPHSITSNDTPLSPADLWGARCSHITSCSFMCHRHSFWKFTSETRRKKVEQIPPLALTHNSLPLHAPSAPPHSTHQSWTPARRPAAVGVWFYSEEVNPSVRDPLVFTAVVVLRRRLSRLQGPVTHKSEVSVRKRVRNCADQAPPRYVIQKESERKTQDSFIYAHK